MNVGPLSGQRTGEVVRQPRVGHHRYVRDVLAAGAPSHDGVVTQE
jgi:hypothetical protein